MGPQGRTPPDSLPGNSPQECRDGSVDSRGGPRSCSPDERLGDITPGRGDSSDIVSDWWSHQKGNTVALTNPRRVVRAPFRIGHLFPADAHDAVLTPPSDRGYRERVREPSWDDDDEDGDGDRSRRGRNTASITGSAGDLRRESGQSQPMESFLPHVTACNKGLPGPIWPEPEEAAALLDEYRTHLAPVFPFVALSPNTTAAELRTHRPFVWKGVMMAACRLDGARQIVLGNALLREVMGASFLRPQKGLDLLQGLQLLVAWFHYNVNSFQMTNLLYLMRSLCSGLCLLEGVVEEAPQAKQHSLEQMRAFAGSYYLITL